MKILHIYEMFNVTTLETYNDIYHTVIDIYHEKNDKTKEYKNEMNNLPPEIMEDLRNSAKNFLVAQKRRASTTSNGFDIEDAENFEEGGQLRELSTPESELISKQVAQTVHQALNELPEELRTAITLREIEGLSYEEIASAMNCPTGTVRSRIFRAREVISDKLESVTKISKEKRR